MGHGNSNKLYVTHAEHSGMFGQHTASSAGARAYVHQSCFTLDWILTVLVNSKQEAPHPGSRTPFDCCALTFQPFTHPVCARNADGTGNVFELVSIIPWLKCVLLRSLLVDTVELHNYAHSGSTTI